jgi:hypothetical protein
VTLFWPLAAAAMLVAAIVVAIRAGRRGLRERIRKEWGRPVDRDRNMVAMAASHRSRGAEAGTAAASLDDRTWDDLHLDAVFAALDRTESTLGQHALYHRLRTTPVGDRLDAFEALVNHLTADAPARERAQMALARLQDPHGYDLWRFARPGAITIPAWHVLFPIITAVTLSLLLLLPFRPALLPPFVGLLAVSFVVRMVTARQIAGVTSAFRQVAPLVAAGEALCFLDGGDIDPLIGSLRSEVPRLRRLKNIARWVSEDPLMISVSWNVLAIAVTDFCNLIYLYLNLLLHLDENGVYFGARDVRLHGASLVRVVAAVGEVDAAISVASYRAGRSDWTRPHFSPPGSPAVLTDIRHPLLVDAVPNTITLRAANGVLVTGSNMSGKSTFLRTVGVTTILAQTINTCLATAYEAPIFKVQSCIGRTDDLLAGKSYYIVEVEALLQLVRSSTEAAPHLFLLDELFRGTNAVERIAAGQAVLAELVIFNRGSAPNPVNRGSVPDLVNRGSAPNPDSVVRGAPTPRSASSEHGGRSPHVVLAATHDNELVDLLQEQFAAYHFEDAVGADGLVFNHRLQAGPATTRNAIALLRLHGAPATLVDRALSCAATLDRQRGGALTAR